MFRHAAAAVALAAFAVCASAPTRAQDTAVGFERITVPGTPDLSVGVWFPSSDAAPAEPNTPFRQALALGGALEGDERPLVVISHGNGGWMGGHADAALALARAGYVVAAPQHTGDSDGDESASPAQWAVTRPAEIVATIDHMAGRWRGGGHVDAARIGVFGFSAGGYSGLVAAGATPDFALATRFCEANPGDFVCELGIVAAIGPGPDVATLASDPRIGALAIAAPGLGFAFAAEGLQGVTVPVQIWSGALDERVPHATNGAPLAAGLPPGADVHLVEKAGHFAFLNVCNPLLEQHNPKIWQMVCVDAPGFDRAAFHTMLNGALVDFFDSALAR